MKKCIILVAIMHMCLLPLTAQNTTSKDKLPTTTITLTPTERQELTQRDKLEQEEGLKIYHFGKPFERTINFLQEAKKIETTSSVYYKYVISCPDASSINCIFSDFSIPDQAILHLYDYHTHKLLESFTNKRANPRHELATLPYKTNAIEICYEMPTNMPTDATIRISHIVYGYRDAYPVDKAGFGSVPAGCIPNVNCPEYASYQNIKRSVVMLMTDLNSALKSGTLINNTANDKTPYLLTCYHAGINTAGVFLFNYESPSCDDIDVPKINYLIGCDIVAQNSYSDFTLIRLLQTPPDSFNVFYAGWDKQDIATTKTIAIHHPAGDIKKISIDEGTTLSDGYNNTTGNTHWKVENWETGVTLAVSSGSALFNANNQIIGQLHGGLSGCDAASLHKADWYGKFATSWEYGSTPATRLKEWLDPSTTNATTMAGIEGSSIVLQANDVRLIGFSNLSNTSTYCEQYIAPRLTVKNAGNNIVQTLHITHQLDNANTGDYTWNGTIGIGNQIDIPITALNLSIGIHSINANINLVNSMNDPTPANNFSTVTINRSNVLNYRLHIKTDAFGQETSWKIVDASNTVVLQTNPNTYEGYMDYYQDICLPVGCYKFIIKDAGDDGICCSLGTGEFSITETATNRIIGQGGQFFGADTVSLCTLLGINNVSNNYYLDIYPNPSNGTFYIYAKQLVQKCSIQITNTIGQIIYNSAYTNMQGENKIQLPTITAGIYFVTLETENGISYKKILVE